MRLLSIPSRAISSLASWANKPLVLKKEDHDDSKKITEYGLWRKVNIGSTENYYEGLTDRKHIVIYEGDALSFDLRKYSAFTVFTNAIRCINTGNRNAHSNATDIVNRCLDDRYFPSKPQDTLLLIEGLEQTERTWDKAWTKELDSFQKAGGKVWRLPTFQDAAIELLNKGDLNDRDIKNLLSITASNQLQSSGLLELKPEILISKIDDSQINSILEALKQGTTKQLLRSHHFTDLKNLDPLPKFGGSPYSAQDIYLLILRTANQMRTEKIKEAMSDNSKSLLMLTDKDHRNSFISDETLKKLTNLSNYKILNGEPYKGHSLLTYLMPGYKNIQVVSGLENNS